MKKKEVGDVIEDIKKEKTFIFLCVPPLPILSLCLYFQVLTYFNNARQSLCVIIFVWPQECVGGVMVRNLTENQKREFVINLYFLRYFFIHFQE